MRIRATEVLVTLSLLLVAGQSLAAGEVFLTALLPGSSNSILTSDNENYWRLQCRVDAMDDFRSCSITYHLSMTDMGHFLTVVDQNQNVAVLVTGGNAYPGSKKIIRVDDNGAHQTVEDQHFVGSPALLKEMRSGETLRTRWYDWPYNYKQDKEQPLSGYGDVLDLALTVARGTEFSLPLGSIEHLHYWEGVGLRSAHEDILAALDSKHFRDSCNLDFELNERVEEILKSIPGVAGAALRNGYARKPHDGLPTKCDQKVAKITRGIGTIPNLKYPE